MEHKFDYRWTLKEANFTKDKGEFYANSFEALYSSKQKWIVNDVSRQTCTSRKHLDRKILCEFYCTKRNRRDNQGL